MEPVTVASAIAVCANKLATYILPEAFKEGGKALGKGVSEIVAKLITTVCDTIRGKFATSDRSGILVDFETAQTENNQVLFEMTLKNLMEKDTDFANKLIELVNQLESLGVVRQIGLTGITTEENLEDVEIGQEVSQQRGNIEQTGMENIRAKRLNNVKINQKA